MAKRGDLARLAMYMLREQVDDPDDYGVVAPAGTPMTLNFTTEAHVTRPVIKRSQTGKANLLPGGARRVGLDGDGPITIEVGVGEQLLQFIEMGFGSVRSAELNISDASIAFAAAGNEISADPGVLTNVKAGTWIEVRSSASNSGRMYVDSKAAADGPLVIAYKTLVNEAAPGTATIRGFHIRNGTSLISATLERHNKDYVVKPYQHYTGFVAGGIEVTMTFEEIVIAVLSGMSRGAQPRAAASVFDPRTPSAPDDLEDSIVDMTNNVRLFRQGGVLDGNLRSFNFNHQNATQLIKLGMVDRPEGVSLGIKSLTGTLGGFHIDGDARYDLAESHDPTDFHLEWVPDVGEPLVVSIFRARFSGFGDQGKSGNEGPIVSDLAFECDESDDIADVWIQVCGFPPAA